VFNNGLGGFRNTILPNALAVQTGLAFNNGLGGLGGLSGLSNLTFNNGFGATLALGTTGFNTSGGIGSNGGVIF
jgi:hypothetical protein